jgi:outer membrane phospholipase A
MKRLRSSLCLLLVLVAALSGRAEEPVPLVTMVAPSERLSPASTWRVDLVAFNPGTSTCYYRPPATLLARAGAGGTTVNVEFAATEPGRITVPPGGFGLRSYVAAQPPALTGLVALEFPEDLPAVLRTAISVDPKAPAPAAPNPAPSAPLRHLVHLSTASSAIERTFAGRFGLHESIYFIYGPDAPAAKFQLSFKYRLMRFGREADGGFTHTLQAGYTQRSLWDIDGNSSPFYDTSYMPELMFQSLAPMPADPDQLFTPLGVQFSLKHESNGRDGANSRSLNTAVLRGAFLLGALDRWHLIVAPEIFAYLTSLEDNPRLEQYRGNGRLRLVLERNNRRPSLVYSFHAGEDFNHPTHQFDLTIPFRTSLLDVETSLLIQYFTGYGESLLEYEKPSEVVRAGLSLVR